MTRSALLTQNAGAPGWPFAFDADFHPLPSTASGVDILDAVGLRPTSPPPASPVQGGAPTDPLRHVAEQVQVFIEAPCQVQYAGLVPRQRSDIRHPRAPLLRSSREHWPTSASNQTAEFLLFVPVMPVATKSVSYPQDHEANGR